MDLSGYRTLWVTRGVPGLVISSLLARLPTVILTIPMSFLAKDAAGSFSWSGVVAGAYAVGTAVGAPVWARRADRHPPGQVVFVAGLCWSVALAALAATPDAWFRLMPVVSALAGMMAPPVSATTRAAWARLTTGRGLRTAYALDATTAEFLFVVGPMLGALMVTFASPRAGLFTTAAWSAAAVWWFGRQLPPSVRAQHDRAPLTVRELLVHRHRLAVIVAFAVTVACFATTALAIVAYADERGDRLIAGWLEIALSIGSLVGGMVVGALPGRRPSHAWRRTALMALGIASCALATWSPWTLGLALLGAGLFLAPTIAAMYERLGALTPDRARTEAFGWMSGAGMMGSALGSAIAGMVIETYGVAQAFGVAAAYVFVSAAALIGVPPAHIDHDAPATAVAEPG